MKVQFSCTFARTAEGSMVRAARISADSASMSALSLPRTPAWPVEKIHKMLSSWLAVMTGFQMA